ncbi:hypothetical protein NL676_039659 [Syzygium grande]|nr:hypothetical protein NL676_039659 [Syzygium grande]
MADSAGPQEMSTRPGHGGEAPASHRVKNKTSAPIRITPERILREARRASEVVEIRPRRKITRSHRAGDYRLPSARSSGTSSAHVRMERRWGQKCAQMGGVVSEGLQPGGAGGLGALSRSTRNHTLWLKYVDMEMKNKFINHAGMCGTAVSRLRG